MKPIPATDRFFDTNILLYLISADAQKAEIAEAVIAGGGVISVQVLNEFANVARRKYNVPWPSLHSVLRTLEATFEIEAVTVATHRLSLRLVERDQLQFYDAMLLAAAILAGCDTFLSEDMQHGQVIEGLLTIRNPFL